jgi:hypothetical protein
MPDLNIEYNRDSWKYLAVLKATLAKNTSPTNISTQFKTPSRE